MKDNLEKVIQKFDTIDNPVIIVDKTKNFDSKNPIFKDKLNKANEFLNSISDENLEKLNLKKK